LKSANESYEGGLLPLEEVDQNKVGEKNTQNFTVNTAYTEPLGKNETLQLSYQINNNE
jgi:hypothetical protein